MTHRKSLRLLRRTVKVFMCWEEKFGKLVVFSPPAAEWEESGLSPVGDPQDSLSRRAWRRSSWGPAWKGRRSPWAREGSGWECSTQSESRCSWLWGARVHVPRSTSEVCKDTRPRFRVWRVHSQVCLFIIFDFIWCARTDSFSQHRGSLMCMTESFIFLSHKLKVGDWSEFGRIRTDWTGTDENSLYFLTSCLRLKMSPSSCCGPGPSPPQRRLWWQTALQTVQPARWGEQGHWRLGSQN